MQRVLLILGPTASGKSALALALAERVGAWIVNADSMQVYADLRSLTARPDAADLARAPHRLYGHIDGAQRYSTGRWVTDALGAIAAARAAGAPVILVGGTGLYFKALTEGLAAAPAAPAAMVEALMGDVERYGAPALHQRLADLDAASAAELSRNDAPRLIRALSVLVATGKPLRQWRLEQPPAPLARSAWLGLTLWPDRQDLYQTIDDRFGVMLNDGALEEARALIARGLEPTLPLMKAHGLPWLKAHLDGALPLPEAHALAVRDTRRYAKRQFTWMAGQAGDWQRLTQATLADRLATAMDLWRADGLM